MNVESIKDFITVVRKYSPNCFISPNFELIVEPENNIYFRLEDVNTELELKCKVLAWLSRPSCKGVSDYWQKRIKMIVNEYLETEFTFEDMMEIYTYLGNDLDRDKTIEFIETGYNLEMFTLEKSLSQKNIKGYALINKLGNFLCSTQTGETDVDVITVTCPDKADLWETKEQAKEIFMGITGGLDSYWNYYCVQDNLPSKIVLIKKTIEAHIVLEV